MTHLVISLALRDLTTMLGEHSPLQAETSGDKQWDELANLYFDPSGAASFGSYWNLVEETKNTKRQTDIKPKDVKLQKPFRKRIPRNPYSVSNLLDLWELDLVDVQTLAKHNDSHRYLLTAIDVFS